MSVNERVLIIAEAGVNHNGSLDMAFSLVDAAVSSGADVVKFQTWVTEELVTEEAKKAAYQHDNDDAPDQYQMLKRLELSFDDFRKIKDYATKKGIVFLTTPDDFVSLEFVTKDLSLPVIKIGSGELTNLPFLKVAAESGKDIILSTGMGGLDDVRNAMDALKDGGAKNITLLHCTSSYPAPLDSVNLKAMNHLYETFGCRVGYSDHTKGTEVSVAAVALGARVIEKHFTLDKNLPGPDHKASLEPKELSEMVRQIRNVEIAISGSGKKEISEVEVATRSVVMKGIYAKHDIQPGEVIQMKDLSFKRPVTFFPAFDYNKVEGRTAGEFIAAGQPIRPESLI